MGKKDEDVRFSKFGTVSFTSITKTNDFIDKLENGQVMGTRCKKCGQVFFPPRADCFQCLSSDVEWFPVEGTGKLLTYSKLQYGPVGFEADLPYTIAVLDYGKYKVFGRIAKDIPDDQIKVGITMKTVANPLANGKVNFVFQKA